jgi:hypothetical protein
MQKARVGMVLAISPFVIHALCERIRQPAAIAKPERSQKWENLAVLRLPE